MRSLSTIKQDALPERSPSVEVRWPLCKVEKTAILNACSLTVDLTAKLLSIAACGSYIKFATNSKRELYKNT